MIEILAGIGGKIASALYSVAMLDPIYLIVIFVLFVIIVFRILEIVKKAVYVAIASALFPIFLDKVVGIPIEVSLNSSFYFAVFGVTLYLIYEALRFVYGLLKIVWGALKVIGKIISAPFVFIHRGISKIKRREKRIKYKK